MNNGNPRTRGRRSNNVAQAGNIVDYMARYAERMPSQRVIIGR